MSDDRAPVTEKAAEKRERSALAGARAGRGFRYQDAVTAAIAVVGHITGEAWTVAPEGDEDVTLTTGVRRFQLQVRSRRSQQRELSASTVGRWLADTWERHIDHVSDPGTRVGIIIDREVAGVSPQGFSAALHGGHANFRTRLDRVPRLGGVSVDDLLARSHIFVSAEPATFATDLLAKHLDVAPLVAEVAFRTVLAHVAALADERADGVVPNPSLDAGELTRLLTETLLAVDLGAVEAPIRDGFCEHADFVTPVSTDAFYTGVDVVPGHIASGLVVDRPDIVDDILAVLARSCAAVVAGPSGIGKTAAALLAAHESRDDVRWIRVRRLGPAHELLRYADVLRASTYAPVGFILDDIGRLGYDLWDQLSREAKHRPGVLLLATAREEDLDQVQEAPESIVLRPRLTAELAERIWSHLLEESATTTPGWVEAFESTDGLTLEFVHYLTTGERLPELIRQQVDHRRNERRDEELAMIRVVALAARHGATTDIRRYLVGRSLSEADLQRVLARLIDEHLVREVSDERVGGMHRLRSIALVEASHRIPPPSLARTAAEVIQVVPAEELAGLVASLIGDEVLSTSESFSAINLRLESDPDHETLSMVLNGLRLAGLRQFAQRARAVFDEHGVPASMRRTAAGFVLLRDSNLSSPFDDRVQTAVAEIRTLPITDLRPAWLDHVRSELVEQAIDSTPDLDATVRLIGSFSGLGEHGRAVVDGVRSQIQLDDDLKKLASILGAATLVSRDVAVDLQRRAGGEDDLLERVRMELPWTTEAEIRNEPAAEGDDSDERVVAFKYLALSNDEDEADVHRSVVERCQLVLRLFPDADVVAGTAIDPAGNPLGFRGYLVADKRIPRRNLPSPDEITWNRQFLNTFAEAGSESRTSRQVTEAEILRSTAAVARRTAEDWVRRAPLRPSVASELERISDQAQHVWKTGRMPGDPALVETSLTDIGDAASACRMVCGNALPRLYKKPDMALAAFIGDTVRPALESLVGIGYWRLIGEDLDDDVMALVALLTDLHTVLHYRLVEDSPASKMRRAERSGSPVSRCAELAAQELDRRFDERLEHTRASLVHQGMLATVMVLPMDKSAGTLWPAGQIAVAVECETALEWLKQSDAALSTVAGAFEPARKVTLIPLRQDVVLPSFSISTFGGTETSVFPDHETGRLVAERLDRSTLMPRAVDLLGSVITDGAVMSGLKRLAETRPLLEEEGLRLDAANEAVEAATNQLSAMVSDDASGVLSSAIGAALEAFDADDLAGVLSTLAQGDHQEALGVFALFVAAAVELESNPTEAASRIEGFLTDLSDLDESE